MKTTSSIVKLSRDRIAVGFVTDNQQSVTFLTRVEFCELMVHMFEFRDAHKEELQEAVAQMQG